ncbi:MAG: DoxX family protein [Deltaproteobacteria bacterium]|nr:DoxX family protein [Deltaproteobacteria bacterium]
MTAVTKQMEQVAPLVGRILIAVIFIYSGIGKLADPAATAGYIGSKGLPLPMIAAVGAGVVEAVGGLALALGLFARAGAIALIAFMIPTTIIFHNPSGLDEMQARMQTIQLLKNLAIIGGLFAFVAFGAGPLSLDAWRRRASERPEATI